MEWREESIKWRISVLVVFLKRFWEKWMIFCQKKVRDPRVQEITITEVDVTGDLQIATVYYTTLQTLASERQATERGLEKSKGLIRRELGKRLSLYKTPELIFKRDESVDYGNHIEELLKSIQQEDEER